MSNQVFNFGAGPSMLPVPVMEQIQAELRDYQGRGMSIIEMNHRSDEFQEIFDSAKALFRELMDIPDPGNPSVPPVSAPEEARLIRRPWPRGSRSSPKLNGKPEE